MKRAVLKITDQLLVDLLKGLSDRESILRRFRVIKNALPEDAKPVRVAILDNSFGGEHCGELGILIESESFKNVEPGERYPYLKLPVLEVVE